MQKPTIVIATGYEALFAYLLIPYGDPLLVKRIEFACSGQIDGPLMRWDDERICYIEIRDIISRILDRYQCESWGLACRSEQVTPIKRELSGKHRATLAAMMETDCEPINLCNVEARYMEAAEGVPCALASLWA